MSLVLIITFGLRHLDQLLELGNLDFQKLNRILGGDLLSQGGSRKLKCRLELAGEGFKAVNDVLWDVRCGLRLVVLTIIKYHKGGFVGSWLTISSFACSSIFSNTC